MSSNPIQKVGRAYVEREADTEKLSIKDPRLADARIPRATPMMIAMIVEDPSKTRVFWSLCCCMIWVDIGRPF
jgi:hypothetical protein